MPEDAQSQTKKPRAEDRTKYPYSLRSHSTRHARYVAKLAQVIPLGLIKSSAVTPRPDEARNRDSQKREPPNCAFSLVP